MNTDYQFRPATADDAREIARLIEISSDGVAAIEWEEQARIDGCEPLDVGEHTYRNGEGDYSWRNCTIVEKNNQVAGMLLTFAMPVSEPRNPENRTSANDSNVFAPYMYLEEPDSWYICGVAFYPEHRGQGLGSKLMQIANDQAKTNGFSKLSLVAFKQNEGSVKLYKRLGYEIVDHAPVVAHPLIHYSSDALLMVANVK